MKLHIKYVFVFIDFPFYNDSKIKHRFYNKIELNFSNPYVSFYGKQHNKTLFFF